MLILNSYQIKEEQFNVAHVPIYGFSKKDTLTQEIRNTKSFSKDKKTEKAKKIINKKSKISITKTEIDLDKDVNNKGSEIVKYVSKKVLHLISFYLIYWS